MQPDLGFPMSAPGLGLLGAAVAIALGLSWLASRVARVTALQRWHRGLGIASVLAWFVAAWLLGLRLLAAAGPADLVARAVLLSLLVLPCAPVLRDLWHGLALGLEGRLRVGDRIAVNGLEGRMTHAGLRKVGLRLDDGTEAAVPHRLADTTTVLRFPASSHAAHCEFDVPVPEGSDLRTAAHDLAQACSLSPYAAPGRTAEVFVVATEGPLRLRVRGVAFDRMHIDHFRGDVLARYSGSETTVTTTLPRFRPVST